MLNGSDHHVVMLQALHEDPPLLPHQLLRKVVRLAQEAREAAVAGSSTALPSTAWYDEEAVAGDEGAELAADLEKASSSRTGVLAGSPDLFNMSDDRDGGVTEMQGDMVGWTR